MKIAFLGAGNMGTALAKVVSENGHEIIMWSIEEDVVQDINNNGTNSKYLKGVRLKGIKASGDIEYVLKDSEIVVFAVPSHVVRKVCERAKGKIPKRAIIVDVAKGLEEGTNKRMSEIISEYFNNDTVAIGGPSIANELAVGKKTYVVFASKEIKSAEIAKGVFKRDYYNIELSDDVVGVELCGTFKNVVAIIGGICDGLGYGLNTKSGLITMATSEIATIIKEMGGNKTSIYGLAGIGDIVVTSMSKHSRNRRFGERIAKGEEIETAVKNIGQVVEGIRATKIAYSIVKEKSLDCPIITTLYSVLFEDKKILNAF